MKNKFKVFDDYIVVYLPTRGEIVFETIIDKEDFDLVNGFPNTWYVRKSDKGGLLYVIGNVPGPKANRKTVQLHRFLLSPPKGMVIDHINKNSLDNRRRNLRIVTNEENQQNRTRYATNTSGYRGVSWRDGCKKWRAYLQIDGVFKHLGHFDTAEEASVVATEARRRYMPFSNEL